MVHAGLCRSQLVVGLRQDECLSFVGSVELRVAMGAVEVLGHVMEAATDAETDAATPMHAPCWLGALTLHSVQPSAGSPHAIRTQCFAGGDLKRLITSIGRTAGVSAVVVFNEMSHTFDSIDCFWGSAPSASPAPPRQRRRSASPIAGPSDDSGNEAASERVLEDERHSVGEDVDQDQDIHMDMDEKQNGRTGTKVDEECNPTDHHLHGFRVVAVERRSPCEPGLAHVLPAQSAVASGAGRSGGAVSSSSASASTSGPTVVAGTTNTASTGVSHSAATIAINTVVVPQLWRSVVRELSGGYGVNGGRVPVQQSEGLRVVVCGRQGLGKSTLSRFLVNNMLRQHAAVAYLETDPGQPELGPPGLLSLHLLTEPLLGPAHSHCRQPFRARFLGELSAEPDPLAYLEHVRALIGSFHDASVVGAETAPMPLIVNTHGWVSGMGLDLLLGIFDHVAPTHVLHLVKNDVDPQLPVRSHYQCTYIRQHGVGTAAGAPTCVACKVQRIVAWSSLMRASRDEQQRQEPVEERTVEGEQRQQQHRGRSSVIRRSGVEQRTLRFAAYFLRGLPMQSVGGGGGGGSKSASFGALLTAAASAMAAATPLRVAWRGLTVAFPGASASAGLSELHLHAPSHVLQSLNGALVALAVYEGGWQPCSQSTHEQHESAHQTELQSSNASVGGIQSSGDAHRQPAVGNAKCTPADAHGMFQIARCAPASAECVGLGLVRSVDVAARTLLVLTPVHAQLLSDVNLLLRGSITLPVELALDPNSPFRTPYVTTEALSALGTGGAVMRSRSNIKRQRTAR